jgi:hypothetical protein
MNSEARSSIDNLLSTLRESLAQAGQSLLPLLTTMSRFSSYSLANQFLMFAQRPDAACVMGYRAWNRAGYQVRKGEKGIAIYAPMLFANKRDITAETDNDAAPRLGYRVACVFDIIAYHNLSDWEASGYDPNAPVQLRIVPASGGTPIAVLDWATDGSWSNNSRRLAFWGWEGEIGTVGLDGTVTRFDFAAFGNYEGYGCNPDDSPDGKLIVYERYECFWGAPGPLMLIPVNQKGEALGAPYPITSGGYYAGQPSFSNDGKTIVFAGNASDPTNLEWGLYTVSVYGGDPVVMFDRPGKGEYDPAYSKNGRYVVFSGPE